MTEPTALASDLRRWQRALVTLVGVLLLVHSVLLALWLAPSSPVRDVVGEAQLSAYVDPYFQQGDETVGTGSNRVDEALSVRASVRPEGGGEPTVTPWIDVTAGENTSVRGEVDPSRAHQIARRVATNLNFALFALTAEQRETIAGTTAEMSTGQLQQRLRVGAGNGRDIENFIANDQMATQFASLWLGAAMTDVEIVQVQYRVGRRVVPDYADRNTQKVTDIDVDWFDIGWRAAFRADPAARAAFADHVEGIDRG